jgi:sec-independent protein translocase protein TatA
MGSFSIWHWLIVFAVIMLLFGAGRVSSLMGDLAQGVKAFKKGLQDDEPTAETPKALSSAEATASALHTDGAHQH